MVAVDIEIILNKWSRTTDQAIINIVKAYMISHDIQSNTTITTFDQTKDPILYENIHAIIIENLPKFQENSDEQIKWHVYKLDGHGYIGQQLHGTNDSSDNNQDGADVIAATNLTLPSTILHGLWESLYYDDQIKSKLLRYVATMMQFAEHHVDSNRITCNRVVLLHGPPGTGKTSLCRALAHKLAARHKSTTFPAGGLLIEINAHGLFSKWFSESGKQVAKMFARIREALADPRLFVCLLVDEIESVARARTDLLAANEPTDSIRAVNALLTEIDRLRDSENVLILATSNVSKTIDLAFVDRADLKLYIGLPTFTAIQAIYRNCLDELMVKNVIPRVLLDEKQDELRRLAVASLGFSGRTLRRIPLVAYAWHYGAAIDGVSCDSGFIDAMLAAVQAVKIDLEQIE